MTPIEVVMADDGFGARLDRRMADRDDGVSPCAHCGATTVWIYRRSHSGPISTGQDHLAVPVRLESWREKPYCTMLCAQRAIRHGNLNLPGVEPYL